MDADSTANLGHTTRTNTHRRRNKSAYRYQTNAVLGLLLLLLHHTSACTTTAIGRLATTDGSVIVSQSDDGDGQVDARIVAVPAQTHLPHAHRPIHPDAAVGYPRYVGTDRGNIPPYAPDNYDPSPSQPTGYIPQVATTFAYWEGDYGHLNSQGVGIGETSCSARILAPVDSNATISLLPVEELSRLAMERTNSSRAAVLLMGALAEKYGFYGVLRLPNPLSTVPNEGGESLMVGDANEAWVFHVLSDGKGGAIWCAQRVKDQEIAVVANMFTIRDVDLTDTQGQHFLYSDSMVSIALEKGWWKESDGAFDFTRIYSYGEYYAQGYSSNRMWRAMDLLAPSLQLNRTWPGCTDKYPLFKYPQYPFSVKPDRLVTVQDVMAIHRDYYQNTSIDMSQGPGSGAWGLPVRFNPEQAYNGQVKGNWHRPMGSFRTGYTSIVQLLSVANGPEEIDYNVVHFAPHTSLGSTFIPVYGQMLKGAQGDGSVPYQATGLDVADPRANDKGVDRSSVYWAVRYAINIAYQRFRDMHPLIVVQQNRMEAESARRWGEATGLTGRFGAFTSLQAAEMNANHTAAVLKAWWTVSDQMIVHWSDGFRNEYFDVKPLDTEYPKWWLTQVGYENGPLNPVPNLP
jgi:dipeptidase